jgi:large subunit ribosomal protein L6
MSRIGKKPIEIPKEVKVKIKDEKISIEGPKGKLEKKIPTEIKVEIKEGKIFVSLKKETKTSKALWGTMRQLISNMVEGVTKGFEKKLIIQGLGYKARTEGDTLVLNVGYSHPVKISLPQELKVSVEKNVILVSGIDKELVGQFAAKIRSVKKVDPYKEKGIKYIDEKVKRKVAKKTIAGK